MSSASDWLAQNNAMSSVGTNPGKLCTSSLSLQRRITKGVTRLEKAKDTLESIKANTVLFDKTLIPD